MNCLKDLALSYFLKSDFFTVNLLYTTVYDFNKFICICIFLGDSNDLPKVDEVSISQDLSKSEPSLTTAASNTNNQCDKNGGVSPPLPAKRPPSDRRRKKSSKGEDGGSSGGSGKEVQLLLRR